ncbi:MAG: TerB family tellurite resistance protein [Cyanobacteria bacterium J06650_10]
MMNIQPPPISPRQMNLLRVVLSMAWADETLEQKEVDVMLNRFSQLFATDPEQQDYLQSQLKEYFVQDVPLEEAASKITSEAEKEIALRLSYEVINASARTPEESNVNAAEKDAYRKLISHLNLPAEIVARAEQEATAALNKGGDNIVDMLAYQLRDYLAK